MGDLGLPCKNGGMVDCELALVAAAGKTGTDDPGEDVSAEKAHVSSADRVRMGEDAREALDVVSGMDASCNRIHLEKILLEYREFRAV